MSSSPKILTKVMSWTQTALKLYKKNCWEWKIDGYTNKMGLLLKLMRTTRMWWLNTHMSCLSTLMRVVWVNWKTRAAWICNRSSYPCAMLGQFFISRDRYSAVSSIGCSGLEISGYCCYSSWWWILSTAYQIGKDPLLLIFTSSFCVPMPLIKLLDFPLLFHSWWGQ